MIKRPSPAEDALTGVDIIFGLIGGVSLAFLFDAFHSGVNTETAPLQFFNGCFVAFWLTCGLAAQLTWIQAGGLKLLAYAGVLVLLVMCGVKHAH